MLYQNFAKNESERRKQNTSFKALDKVLLYGNNFKSTVCASLSAVTKNNVLAISPSGSSRFLEKLYPNFLSYQVNNLDEVNVIINDIIKETNDIEKIRIAVQKNDNSKLSQFKAQYAENFETMLNYAMGKVPYNLSAVVIEESNIISTWVEDKLAKSIQTEAIGFKKDDLGAQWNFLKKDLVDFYGNILRIPLTVILCTSEFKAGEKQKIDKISPDLCSGSAQRILIDLIGNVFYGFKDDNGKIKVMLNTNIALTKQKLLFPNSKKTVPNEIDITGNPEKLWTELKSLNES